MLKTQHQMLIVRNGSSEAWLVNQANWYQRRRERVCYHADEVFRCIYDFQEVFETCLQRDAVVWAIEVFTICDQRQGG